MGEEHRKTRPILKAFSSELSAYLRFSFQEISSFGNVTFRGGFCTSSPTQSQLRSFEDMQIRARVTLSKITSFALLFPHKSLYIYFAS